MINEDEYEKIAEFVRQELVKDYELMEDMCYNEEDAKAFFRVIKYYSSPQQWEEFVGGIS